MRQSLTNLFASSQISKLLMRTVVAMFLLTISSTYASAQAKLSIQGIIKRSNGSALEDGVYPIKFNIYAKDNTPPGILWDEVITDVDVNGGIYSEILGDNAADPLTLPFDQDYLLGIEIGGKEMNPRIELTSAPYALSIRGQSNLFPSAGQVQADRLKVAEGVTVNKGAPLVNNTDGSKGYSFTGDNDSGVFSTQDGEASIYTNGIERIEVTTSAINLNNPTTVKGNVNLENNGGITYTNSNNQSFQGWRLVDVDDFNSDDDGWAQYAPVAPENTGWNNGGNAQDVCVNCGTFNSVFVGNILIPNIPPMVIKKQFTIAGSFTKIKVKFRYYALNTWDSNDFGFAGFATGVSGENFKVAWVDQMTNMAGYNGATNTSLFNGSTNFKNSPDDISDYWKDVEMTAQKVDNSNSFYVYIGSGAVGTNDEGYGVGGVEIWVR